MKLRPPSVRTPDHITLRRGDPEARRYVDAYLLMRTLVGVVGMGLPLALVVGDGLFLPGHLPRGSLSAYYHTGMRDVFVGSLFAIGGFLITYMVFHYNWDNVLSVVAGTAAIGVAAFPTGGNADLTPLQERLGEAAVSRIHFTAAAVFILSLAALCVRFADGERRRPDRAPAQRRRGWRLHLTCAAVIVGAVGFIAVSKVTGLFASHSLFYGETAAGLAFGFSWLTKGVPVRAAAAVRVPAAENREHADGRERAVDGRELAVDGRELAVDGREPAAASLSAT